MQTHPELWFTNLDISQANQVGRFIYSTCLYIYVFIYNLDKFYKEVYNPNKMSIEEPIGFIT